MCKKVSYVLEMPVLEKAYGATFAYPNLFENHNVLDGRDEVMMHILIQEAPHRIMPAIWGMLPSSYEDEWAHYQSISNTLNLSEETITNSRVFNKTLLNNRCIIPISGFFVYYLYEGILYPYYVYASSGEPLHVAGVYTRLKDGFYTFSMLTVKDHSDITSIQNVEETIPLLIENSQLDNWLSGNLGIKEIHDYFTQVNNIKLDKHPVAREFFKNDITYDSILEEVSYKNLPAF